MSDSINKQSKAEAIISAIQRGKSSSVSALIKEADRYLLGNGAKPDFFDDFLARTQSDLETTVNGCVCTRDIPDRKDDLKKYKEGYFNEIIQNANDVQSVRDFADSSEPPPVVRVYIAKDDAQYTVRCTYPDPGFSLQNIYAFCTRGNSIKSAKNGQEGMYGIGIKSLFCFVDELSIENNISIQIKSQNDSILNQVQIQKVTSANPGKTTLAFRFTYNKTDEQANKHAGFNVKKLVDFIDAALDYKSTEQFFLSDTDSELLFDARALFFTDLRGDRAPQNCVKEIRFFREGEAEAFLTLKPEETSLQCSSDDSAKDDIRIRKEKIGDLRYILFHSAQRNLSIAMRLYGEELRPKWTPPMERFYSTYFVTTNKGTQVLERATGALINTNLVNSSRSGLERENEKEPQLFGPNNEFTGAVVECLAQLAPRDSDCMDLLCQLLWLYRDIKAPNQNVYFHSSDPSGSEYGNTTLDLLANSMKNWSFGADRKYKYILQAEDGVEHAKKMIGQNRPPQSDDANAAALYRLYQNHFWEFPQAENSGVILYKSDLFNTLPAGVKALCIAVFKKEDLWFQPVVGICFLASVKDLLTARITGTACQTVDFESIHTYLNKHAELNADEKTQIKQLVARYELVDCFDYMGNYSDQAIQNWLFDDSCNDPGYAKKSEEFQKRYGALKEFVQNNRVKLWYRRYCDWPRCWYQVEASSSQNSAPVTDELVLLLLKLIQKGFLRLGGKIPDKDNAKSNADGNDNNTRSKGEDSPNCNQQEFLFVHNISKSTDPNCFILYNRPRTTTDWTRRFQYMNLDCCFKHPLSSFNAFKSVRKMADEIEPIPINPWDPSPYESIHQLSKFEYLKSCEMQQAGLSTLFDLFRWLSEYTDKHNIIQADSFKINNLCLDSDAESRSTLIAFVKNQIGNDVFIRIKSERCKNNGAKFIGYCTNLNGQTGIYIRRKKVDDFQKVGNVTTVSGMRDGQQKYLIIFSSFPDDQTVLSSVLEKLGYGDSLCYYIKNHITARNIRTVSEDQFNLYTKRQHLEYEYPFKYEEISPSNEDISNNSPEEIYELLSGEMSYDSHCPVCRQIPTLNINSQKSRSENRNTLIALFSAAYSTKQLYIKLPCCKDCFEEYKNSLTEATVKDVEGRTYKELKLKSRISAGCRSRDLDRDVLISPDNWKLICKFNHLDEETKEESPQTAES